MADTPHHRRVEALMREQERERQRQRRADAREHRRLIAQVRGQRRGHLDTHEEDNLLQKATALTNAQILTLFSQPVILIPTVPGKIIVPVQMMVEVDTRGGALSLSLQWKLRYFGFATNIILMVSGTLGNVPHKAIAISGHGLGEPPGETGLNMLGAAVTLTSDQDITNGSPSNNYLVTVDYKLFTPTISV